ncbi:recombinase family protein [Arthrobacter sp. NPDC080031]|uniref:recombinase family protein n=1 Tax=Arthrobacter sp. NPDC080031 TaxID=3155918 RepID=UPI00344E3FB3
MGLLLGYVRTSTTDQHGQMQFDALIEAGVKEEHIYFDQLSGAKSARERPALSKLLAYAREGDSVLVYRIGRLGRSLIDVLNTVAEMQERGIALRSLVDGIDPSTASVLRRSGQCLIPKGAGMRRRALLASGRQSVREGQTRNVTIPNYRHSQRPAEIIKAKQERKHPATSELDQPWLLPCR